MVEHHIELKEIKAWCWYLAALHQAAGADGRRVVLPVHYQCMRRPAALVGCGTCYKCTQQMICRALYVSSCPQGDLEAWSAARTEAVFQYVTGLDPRLNNPNGLNDDFTEMDSAQFARVMQWAGDMIPMTGLNGLVSSSAYAAAAAETATEAGQYRPNGNAYEADVAALRNGSQW